MTPARWYVSAAAILGLAMLYVLCLLAYQYHEQVAPIVGYCGGIGMVVGLWAWWVWRVFTEHHRDEASEVAR